MKANHRLIRTIFEDPNFQTEAGPKSIPRSASVALCILYAKIWSAWKDIFENPSPYNIWPPGQLLTQFIKVLEGNKKYKKLISTLDDSDDGWSLYKHDKNGESHLQLFQRGIWFIMFL